MLFIGMLAIAMTMIWTPGFYSSLLRNPAPNKKGFPIRQKGEASRFSPQSSGNLILPGPGKNNQEKKRKEGVKCEKR